MGSQNLWFGDPNPFYTHPNPSVAGSNDSKGFIFADSWVVTSMSTPLHEPKEPSFWTENRSIHPHLETVETVENTRHLVVGEELPTLHDHFKPQEDESRPQPQMADVWNMHPIESMYIWYISLHEWLIFMVNVGKNTGPMDSMGI